MSIFRRFRYLAKKRKELFSAFVAVIFITALLWFAHSSKALTYFFTQNSWAGGASVSTRTRTNEQASPGAWTNYFSSIFTAGADLKLAAVNKIYRPDYADLNNYDVASSNGIHVFATTTPQLSYNPPAGTGGAIKLARESTLASNKVEVDSFYDPGNSTNYNNNDILALDQREMPHVVFRNNTNGIYYKRYNGSGVSGWVPDPTALALYIAASTRPPAFTIDNKGRLHVLFYDASAGVNKLFYKTCDASMQGDPNATKCTVIGDWSGDALVDGTLAGGTIQPALFADKNGKLHMVYGRDIPTIGLYYRSCDANNCAATLSASVAINSTETSFENHIVADESGKPRILSIVDGASAVDGIPRVYWCNASCAVSGSWKSHDTTTLGTGNISASGFSIDKDGTLYTTYGRATDNTARFVQCAAPGANPPLTCTPATHLSWANGAGTGKFDGNAVMPTGKPHFFYSVNTNSQLQFQRCTGDCTVLGGWTAPVQFSPRSVSDSVSVAVDSDDAPQVIWQDGGTAALNYLAIKYKTPNWPGGSVGVYTSSVKDLDPPGGLVWGAMSWELTNMGGGNPEIRVRTAEELDGMGNPSTHKDGSGVPAFSLCTPIASGGDISSNNCVKDGDRYFQFQIKLAGDGFLKSDIISSLKLNYSYMSPSGTLVSTAFDSESAENIISRIVWDEITPAGTKVKFQIRTAASPSGGTLLGNFVGYDGTPTTYFTTSDLASGCTVSSGTVTCNIIPAVLSDLSNDQWFQYQVTLESSGGATPTVDNVQVGYVVNAAPSVTAVTASQDAAGVVNVTYDVNDTDCLGGCNMQSVALLFDGGARTSAAVPLGTGSITLAGNYTHFPENPPGGQVIQIDKEYILYTTRVGNQLSGITRGYNWGVIPNTREMPHAANATVWMQATTATGAVGSSIATGNGKAITWLARDEIPGVFTSSAKIMVSANDGEQANQIGTGQSVAFTLDTKIPDVGEPLASCLGQFGVVANDCSSKTNNSIIALKLDAADDSPLQMQISDDGVFDNVPPAEGWGAYLATKNWTLTSTANGTKTIQVNFKDDKGNTAGPFSATIEYDTKWPDDPIAPDGIGMQEFSNPSTGEIFFFVSWPRVTNADNDFYRYNISRSTDGGTFTLIEQFTSDTENNFIDNPCPSSCIGSTFWYRYTVEDNTGLYDNNAVSNTGNVSPDSPAKQITATGQTPDSIPPTLNSPAIGSPGVNYVPVTWTASETPSSDRSDSEIAYYPQGGLLSGAQILQNNTFIAQGGTHEVNILGLEPGQSYYLQARSKDQSNNIGSASTSPWSPTSPDLIFPDGRSANSLSFTQSPQVTLTSVRSAVISWQTNNPASSIVEYNNLVYGSFDMTTQHTVVLPYTLDPGVSVSFTAKSNDSWGGEISAGGSLSTIAATDNTPPTISNISGAQNGSSATITWDTDEPASSYVEFGTDIINGKPVYTRTVGSRALSPAGVVSSHSVALPPDLLPDHWTPGQTYTYFYRTRSIDGAGNEAISGRQDVQIVAPAADTTLPSIQSVVITGARENSALVTFTTNEPADALIEYAEGGSTSYTLSRFVPAHTTNHAVELVGLKPSTLYKFQITVKDAAGNSSPPDDNGGVGYTFATLRSTVPSTLSISDVQIVAAEGFTRVKFNTNESSVGFVEYGFDDAYGESVGENTSTSMHEIILPADTLGNVMYRFQVRARAADGREAVSRDVAIFITPASEATIIADDTTPPGISQITIQLVTSNSAVISFQTDELALGQIDFGFSSSGYGASASSTAGLYNQTHSFTLTALDPDTEYVFRVLAEDKKGNMTVVSTVAGDQLVFHTAKLPAQPTPDDVTSPSVSGVTVSDITAEGATITWTTNEAANSLVEYGTETGVYAKLAGQTADSDTTHTAVLTDLDPSTTYYFIAVSYDGSANRGESDEQSFETLASSEEEQALEDLKKKIEIEATEDQIQLLQDLLGLSSSTQDLIRQFLLIPEEERDTALDVLLGQIIGPPRIISDIPDIKITDSTADITWDTSKKMSSAIGYASQKLYKEGADDPYVAEAKGPKDEFVYKHSLKLEGLEPNTVYHYQLRGTEKSGKQAMSIDRTFKTLPQKVVFTSVKVKSVNEETVTVLWSTSIAAEGAVEFSEAGAKEKKSQGDPQFKKAHELMLIGLKPKTKYTAVITAKTEEEVLIKSQLFSFTTGVDTVAPEISQVRTKLSLVAGKTDVVQAVINWNTDEPADGQVFYDEGLTKGEIMRQSSPLQQDLTTYHVVVLSKLRPGTVYRFQAVSRDATGNDGASQEFKIITPRKEESVLELIIKNFEDTFGFLQQINN